MDAGEEEPIFELASECEKLFAEHISRLEQQSEQNGAKILGEYQQRFSAWASYLGVFAGSNLCLDRRLRYHTDMRELVLRLLDILETNLFHLLEPSESPTNEPSDSGATQPQPARQRIISDSLDAIVEAIGRLDRLGNVIKKSSVTSQTVKARKFAESFDLTSFEKIAYVALKSLYPVATQSLLEQLTRSMAETYTQYRYRQSRQELLRPRRYPQSHLPTIDEEYDAATGAVSPRLSTPKHINLENSPRTAPLRAQPSTFSHNEPTSLDSREARRRWKEQNSQRARTKSILSRHADYPRPPKNSSTCQWCFAPISKEASEGDGWRRHVNEDHKPYVCISEKCAESSQRFASSSEWFRHMMGTHGRSWHREIHSPSSWICPLCYDEDIIFPKSHDLANHIEESHRGTLKESQVQAIVHQSCLQTLRPQDICPICCMSVVDEQEPLSKKRALNPLDRNESNVDEVFKRPRRSERLAPSHHSRDDERVVFEQLQAHSRTASLSGSEAISIHIAAHLQNVMLLTLRLISIDVIDPTKDTQTISGGSDVASLRASSRHLGSKGQVIIQEYSSPPQDEAMDLDSNHPSDRVSSVSETHGNWNDIPRGDEVDVEDDAFLQGAIASGAFQTHEEKTPAPEDTDWLPHENLDETMDPDVWGYLIPFDSKYGEGPIALKKLTSMPGIKTTEDTAARGFKGKGPAQSIETKVPHSNGYLIGRHPECDLVVNQNTVSNRHCLIFSETKDDTYVAIIEDLSSNGTFVNEAFVGCNQRRELQDNNEIAVLDSARFLFRYPSSRQSSVFLQQYTLLERLGKGHFAEVYLCVEKSTGLRYAAKIFTKTPGIEERTKHEGLQQEIAVLMGISHPNILNLRDIFNEKRAIYMVLELAPHGELFNHIVMKQKLSEDESRKVFRQLFSGIKYLHDRNITHRDIKPENILLADDDLTVKIADFGLAKIIGEETFTTTLCGTPSYVAPEILAESRTRKYTKAVDIWSLGVVLYICLCGFPPFSDELYSRDFPFTLSEQIRSGRFDYPCPYWDSVGDPALDLIDSMLTADPTKRFTIDQCIQHPWMTESANAFNDGTGDLVGGFAGLGLNRRTAARERTLLSTLNSVAMPAVSQQVPRDTSRDKKGKGRANHPPPISE